MEWFFLNNIFEVLRNSSNQFMTGTERLIAGFQLLGIRVTEESLRMSIARHDQIT